MPDFAPERNQRRGSRLQIDIRNALLLAASLASLAGAASAKTSSAEAIASLKSGKAVTLIVEYEAAAVEQEAAALRSSAGLTFDDAQVLALKAQRYQTIKTATDDALASPEIDQLTDYSHLPMTFKRFRSLAAFQAFMADPNVKAVYEDRPLHAVLAQSLPMINQPAVAAVGDQGAGTTVAVIDDGINYTLPAFGGCTSPGVPAGCHVAVSLGFGTGTTDTSHGSNVSAIVLGVAPATQIAMLNAFSGTLAYSADIISAINWAIANQVAFHIAAINMSLGDGTRNTAPCTGAGGNPFATPIANANSAGMAVVVASGNDAYTNGISSPACSPGAISVGAVYDANLGRAIWGTSLCTDATTAADQVTCFSDSSSQLTLLAPGALITAAGFTMGGTSQATPHVAGAVAVLRAAFPAESLAATTARMTGTGVAVTDPRNGLVKPRLNLLEAARPANDAFGNRAALAGTAGTAAGTSLLASEETGEPAHGGSGGAHSVWWKWTAPGAGQVSLDTHGSNFDTLLAVHTGSAVAALTAIAANDNDGSPGGTSGLLFEAQAGKEYEIAVDGANGAAGTVALNWSLNSSAAANLSIGLSGPAVGTAGINASYVVTATNAGPQTATNVRITVTLPASAGFVSASPGCSAAANQVVCNAGTLANAASASFNIAIIWNATDPAATLAASVSSDLPDPVAANNSAALAIAVAAASANADVPALPQWAALLLGALLLVGGRLSRQSTAYQAHAEQATEPVLHSTEP
jgi:uncharacterized repeat protein (TIGR01451 family)